MDLMEVLYENEPLAGVWECSNVPLGSIKGKNVFDSWATVSCWRIVLRELS
jgi:hypothetical protein